MIERLDILGNQFHNMQFCKMMKRRKVSCNEDCENCPLEVAVRVQGYGNQKGRRYYRSKKWDMESLDRECTRY